MDEAMEVGLQEEIIADLTIEYGNEPTFNADIISVKVKDAIREVKNRRNYQATSYTDEEVEKDLYDNYYSVIKNLAVYDLHRWAHHLKVAIAKIQFPELGLVVMIF